MNIKIMVLIRIVIVTLFFTPKVLFAQFLRDYARDEFNRRHLEQFAREVDFENSKRRFEYSHNSPTKVTTLTFSVVLKDKKKYWSRLYTDSIFNTKFNALKPEAIKKGYDTIIIYIHYKQDFWYQTYISPF